MNIKKYTLFTFLLVLVIALLSPILLVVPADFIVYFEYIEKAYSMDYISFLDYSIFEPGYGTLLFLYSIIEVSNEFYFVIISNIILYYFLIQIFTNISSQLSLNRRIFIAIIIVFNPLFFILSPNIIRQLLAHAIFFTIITNSTFIGSKKILKYLFFIIPFSIHLSSILLFIGYLIGLITKYRNNYIFVFFIIAPLLVSRIIYDYLNLDLFHSFYDPPKIYLIIISIISLIYLKFKNVKPTIFWSLYFPIALTISLYDFTQISHRTILVIHYILVFTFFYLFKKIDIKLLGSITLFVVLFFTVFIYRYVN